MNQLGIIHRKDGQLKFVISGWLTPTGKLTLNYALDAYGFLIGRFESLRTIELVKRIRKTYAKSPRRDACVSALIASCWPNQKPLSPRLRRALGVKP